MTVKEFLDRKGAEVSDRDAVCSRMCSFLLERGCSRRRADDGQGGSWDYEERDLDRAFDFARRERAEAERVLNAVLGN